MPLSLSLLTATPLEPSRDDAREQLERELADPNYQRELSGPVRQAIEDFLAWLEDRLGTVGGIDVPFGPLIILVLLIAAIVLIILLVRPRLQRTGGGIDDPLATELGITSEQLRERAREHRRAGRVDEAYRDHFRALVRAAEERTVLSELRGRTATEAATALTRSFPAQGRRLAIAADLFNLSRYGGRPPTAQDCDDVAELDAVLLAAEPQEGESVSAPQVVAPR